MGIEPTSKAWEAFVLPLNYTRVLQAPAAIWATRRYNSITILTGIARGSLWRVYQA